MKIRKENSNFQTLLLSRNMIASTMAPALWSGARHFSLSCLISETGLPMQLRPPQGFFLCPLPGERATALFFNLCIILFIYLLFLAVLGLRCSEGFSLVVTSGSYALVLEQGLLIAVVSLVAEYGLRLNCSVACGIFPDHGSNLCQQVDSFALSPQGSSQCSSDDDIW